jgi:mannose/fructose/N-acetylgalactosamine-specific phosphotransferase system component IIC
MAMAPSSAFMLFPILLMTLNFLLIIAGIIGIIFAIVYFKRMSKSLNNIDRTLASQKPPKDDN